MVKLITLVSMLLPLSSYAEVNFDGSGENGIKEAIVSTEVPVPTVDKAHSSKVQKEWTVMVYLNAKNNLEPFGISDMNEMEMVGSNDNLNIVVQFGRIKGYDTTNGDWKTVRRYYVTKDTDTKTINSQMVADLGKVDMGDYKSLIDFGKWVKQNYPAKKYLLVVWNHGSGWEKSMGLPITKGISYDDETGNHINTPQLGMALKEIGKIDIVDFDACLMAMAEVLYEIKDSVTYIVASEETEPGDGNTYNTFLDKIEANPTITQLNLAKAMVDSYNSHYQSVGDGSTLSVLRAEQADGLLKAVNDFAYALSQTGDKNLVKTAASSAQSYAIEDNKDLYHFAQLVSSKTNDAAVKEKAKALMDFIKNKLVAYNKYSNSSGGWYGPVDYSNSNGIAIYIPASSIGNGYLDLQWSKYSNWDEMISWYLSKYEEQYIITTENKGWQEYVIGGCISWVVSKICDTVWDAAKQKYVELCKDVKTCNEYSPESSPQPSNPMTHQQQHDIQNNIQRTGLR